MRRTYTRGFSAIEGIIIVGVVVLLGGLGYVGWKSFSGSSAASTTASTAPSSSRSVEVITTKADLEKAEKALDDLNFEDDDAAEAELQASL